MMFAVMRVTVPIFLILLTVGFADVAAQGVDPLEGRGANAGGGVNTGSASRSKGGRTTSERGTRTRSGGNVRRSRTGNSPSSAQAFRIEVSEGGSEVTVSGRDFSRTGTADEEGVIEFAKVPSGSYTVRASKNGFIESEQEVFISKQKTTRSVEIFLAPSTASLTVSVNPPDASIEIQGRGLFVGSVESLRVTPGTYVVRVFKTGYASEQRVVSLESAGNFSQVVVSLSPVSDVDLAARAEVLLSDGDTNGAMTAVKKALSINPRNGPANRIAGTIAFQGRNPTESVHRLIDALQFGDTVQIPIRFYAEKGGRSQLAIGMMTVSGKTISMSTNSAPFYRVSVENDSGFELVKLQDPSQMSFIRLTGAGLFDGAARSGSVVIYPVSSVSGSRSDAETSAMFALLSAIRRGRESVPKDFLSVPAFPSDVFKKESLGRFAIDLPSDWESEKGVNQIASFPRYASVLAGGRVIFSHGTVARLIIFETAVGFERALESYVQSVGRDRGHERFGQEPDMNVRGIRFMRFSSRITSSVTLKDETVVIYAAKVGGSELFVLQAVFQSDEIEVYDPVIKRIVSTVEFR